MRYWIRRLSEMWSDCMHIAHRDGWRRGGKYFLLSFLRLFFRHLKFQLIALNLSEPISRDGGNDICKIRSFEPGDLDFVRRSYLPSEAKLCEKRIEAGHLGLLATLNGETAAYCWLCTDISLERVELLMSPEEILFADSFTSPQFRGMGIQTELALESLRKVKNMKFNRIVAYIEKDNAASLAVWQRKLGAEAIGEIDFKRFGVWRKTRILR